MADDIDDLLDEVEDKFCSKKKHGSTAVKRTKRTPHADDDLNKIIDDICEIPTEKERHQRPPQEQLTDEKSSIEKRKCFAVYLGGSMTQQGLANSLNKKSCNSLRCTSCDFKVSSFDNMEWLPETDYLFLRNNAPDFNKLKSSLTNKKGSRAYCCQCSWRSVRDLSPLHDPQSRWVCGKH